MAVLMDAINTLKNGVTQRSSARCCHNTERWLMSNKSDYCFQFAAICEVFGWAPSYVRKNILKYLQMHHANEAKARRRQVRKGWKIGRKC